MIIHKAAHIRIAAVINFFVLPPVTGKYITRPISALRGKAFFYVSASDKRNEAALSSTERPIPYPKANAKNKKERTADIVKMIR